METFIGIEIDPIDNVKRPSLVNELEDVFTVPHKVVKIRSQLDQHLVQQLRESEDEFAW